MDYIIEENILISVDGLYYQPSYEVKCYDGYAYATLSDEDDKNAPKTIRLEYPTRDEVISNDKLSRFVLQYRGLYDKTSEDIHFGDIMIALGVISE